MAGDPLTVRRAIEKLLDGTIRIPGFQRKFVWEPERAALLMDSIYKGYPIGSLLLWRTRSRLKTERRLGVFELPPPDKDFPVDYVLDGQQRLTSIFSTFQTELKPDLADPDLWLPVYYDFNAEEDAQESRFAALKDADVDVAQHFPLSTFLDPIAFSNATKMLPNSKHEEIVKVQQRFLETLVPVETFESEDRTRVAIVFERVNRMGIELDVFQLLTAWTWSEDFDLQERFHDLAQEFDGFGFREVGTDNDLMLRCCAAVLKQDPSPSSMVDMNGSEVRDRFGDVAEALRRAIDFVQTNFFIRNVRLLPYPSLLAPLAAFFGAAPGKSVAGEQHDELVKWVWRACFSHRYSGNPNRNIKRDINEAVKLRLDGSSELANVPCAVGPDFFLDHAFSVRTVATKAFIMLLAQKRPRSFLSGQPVDLAAVLAEANRSEFHHCYPRAAHARTGAPGRPDVLANFAIISRAENREISDRVPSEYRHLMPGDSVPIQQSAWLPDALFADDYEGFTTQRARELAEAVTGLLEPKMGERLTTELQAPLGKM